MNEEETPVKKNQEQATGGLPTMLEQGSRRTFLARAGGAAGLLAAGACSTRRWQQLTAPDLRFVVLTWRIQ